MFVVVSRSVSLLLWVASWAPLLVFWTVWFVSCTALALLKEGSFGVVIGVLSRGGLGRMSAACGTGQLAAGQ